MFGFMKYLNPLAPIGAALGGASKAKAEQRAAGEEMEMDREALRQNGEQNYIDSLFKREDERRQSAGDAFKRLAQYDFINQGGTQTPGVSPYSKPVQGPGELMKQLAGDDGAVRTGLLQRASYADPINPSNEGQTQMELRRLAIPGSDNSVGNVYGDMEKRIRPGKSETIMGILGALLNPGGK